MKKIMFNLKGWFKRNKNKNIKKFHGKHLIEWTFNVAKSIDIFTNIILSIDSQNYQIAKRNGIEVPFETKKFS